MALQEAVPTPRNNGGTARQQPAATLKPRPSSYRMISKYELTVPSEDYQRDRSLSARAKGIAATFDFVAFGTLTVIERRDGSLVIADGGTRHSGAMMRTDLDKLPCQVFWDVSPEQEAEIFRKINVDRDKLVVSELQKAELFAGRDLAVEADKIMREFASYGVHFESLGVIRTLLVRRPRALRVVVQILQQIGAGRKVTAKVMKGLVYVEHSLHKRKETLNQRKYVSRIERVGLHGMESAITGAIPKSASGNTKLYGAALMRVLKIRPTKGDE